MTMNRARRSAAIGLFALALGGCGHARGRSWQPASAAEALAGPVPIASGDPQLGDAAAPVTVVLFADFQCPFCADHYFALREALLRRPGELRVVFKNAPLPFHRHARRAAEVGAAVLLAYGPQAFWRYADEAFRIVPGGGSPDDALAALALDEAPVRAALADRRAAAKVAADRQLAAKLGVRGTPASFVNGAGIEGALPPEDLDRLLDVALADARRAQADGVPPADLYAVLSRRHFSPLP